MTVVSELSLITKSRQQIGQYIAVGLEPDIAAVISFLSFFYM
jgi:hypothetical protein